MEPSICRFNQRKGRSAPTGVRNFDIPVIANVVYLSYLHFAFPILCNCYALPSAKHFKSGTIDEIDTLKEQELRTLFSICQRSLDFPSNTEQLTAYLLLIDGTEFIRQFDFNPVITH